MCTMFVTLFFVSLCIEYGFLINEECFIRGIRGRCTNISKCAGASFLFAAGGISFCESGGLEPQICCSNQPPRIRGSEHSTIVPTMATKTDGLKILPTINPEKNVSLSVKKCMDYHPVTRFKIFVIGGKKSLAKQYPHMALIGYGNENDKHWLCGGSLISLNFVLTAAHCLSSNEYGQARWVRLGDLDLSTDTDDAKPQDFQIIKLIPHSDYRYPIKYHDIALLQLHKNIETTAYVSPACLQTTKMINESSMSASGWGRTDFAGSSSNFLMTLNLKEIDSNECQAFYNDGNSNVLPNGIVDDMMICAGGEIGKDTCDGDSGGPLQVKNKYRSFLTEVYNVVGVTSFGKACGLSKAPGVYTRISYYSKWIESIVWPGES